MGQAISCPCYDGGSNVVFPEDDEQMIKEPYHQRTNMPTTDSSIEGDSRPFPHASNRPVTIEKSKSIRTWDASSKEPDFSTVSSQRAGEEADGDADSHTSPEQMADTLHNVKGEITFSKPPDRPGREPPKVTSTAKPQETEAQRTARERREAHNDRIVATFNSVMLADGLKVLKHHRRSSKKAASRVIRYVPDYGGALVWDKPLRQPGGKASRVPLDAIKQVELEQRIVWISAGEERVGFETSKAEDADLMYQAICILVDRCHA